MIYTVGCRKGGCYWQGSTDNAAQAILWGTEHEDRSNLGWADGHDMYILTEEE